MRDLADIIYEPPLLEKMKQPIVAWMSMSTLPIVRLWTLIHIMGSIFLI